MNWGWWRGRTIWVSIIRFWSWWGWSITTAVRGFGGVMMIFVGFYRIKMYRWWFIRVVIFIIVFTVIIIILNRVWWT